VGADTIALLAAAGFAAGAINAIAGGGSLVSFPALVASGLPTLSANVTNTVAVWPGYAGGTAGYRRELTDQRERAVALGLTSVIGAAIGSVVLLVTDDELFDLVVPFLVAMSAALVACQPKAADLVRRQAGPAPASSQLGWWTHLSVLLAAAYGAYFGGGLGVILLAVLGIFVHDSLQRLNALKSLLSLVINSLALAVFTLFGPVDWRSVAVIAPASLLGGYVGARLARRVPANLLRGLIVVFGLVVAVWLWI
jgi:uncharacterized membrane protein YfcA